MLVEDFRPYDNVRTYRMSCEERGDHIEFLYKFTKGEVSKSFGINVARLAGLNVKEFS